MIFTQALTCKPPLLAAGMIADQRENGTAWPKAAIKPMFPEGGRHVMHACLQKQGTSR